VLSKLVVTLFRTEGLLSAAGDGLAAPAGQTAARWRVLAAISTEGRSVSEIARAWSFARQSVQRVADALEADGLVTYEENPQHRRAKLVVLTEAGRSALADIEARQREWADAVGRRVGLAVLEATVQGLATLLIELGDEGGGR